MSTSIEPNVARLPLQLLGAPAPSLSNAGPGRIGQKPLVLLARLLLESRPVTREAMMTFLWPEANEERARGSLRQALHVLREELGPDSLVADRYAISAASPSNIDLLDFLQAVRQGNGHQAALLYRGHLLDGVSLSDALDAELWLDLERRRLARLFEHMAASALDAPDGTKSPHERLTIALRLRDGAPGMCRHWRYLFEALAAINATDLLRFEQAALAARLELAKIDDPDQARGLL
jgi:DNA-binding SARP family transcriptional activator